MKYYRTIITHDAMGNPLSYRDGMKMTWKNGRKLSSLKTKDNSITYKYDSNGLRTQKDDKNYTTCYYYDSKNNLIGIHYQSAPVLYFYYDSNGNVTSFSYDNTMFYYVKNLQGDVIKIINQAGTEVVSYTYDAWGKIIKQTDSTVYNIANLNPFKYRSYVYDNESGLYYLQSRYYDPVKGRFLNADGTQYITVNILNANIFSYCNNNYINNTDIYGTSSTQIMMPNMVFDPIVSFKILSAAKKLAIKLSVYGYASMYLNSVGCDTALALFRHALFYENNDIGPEIKERIARKIMANYEFMKSLKEKAHLEYMYPYEYNFNSSDNLDLYYGIHGCTLYIYTIIKNGKKYIRVILYDRYDFSWKWPWDDDTLKSKLLNDFGYTLNMSDILTEYSFVVTFTY